MICKMAKRINGDSLTMYLPRCFALKDVEKGCLWSAARVRTPAYLTHHHRINFSVCLKEQCLWLVIYFKMRPTMTSTLLM